MMPVEIRFEHDLLRGAGLHPRGARDEFAAGVDQNRKAASVRSGVSGLLAMPMVTAPSARARFTAATV